MLPSHPNPVKQPIRSDRIHGYLPIRFCRENPLRRIDHAFAPQRGRKTPLNRHVSILRPQMNCSA
jgi:hypothetical protein